MGLTWARRPVQRLGTGLLLLFCIACEESPDHPVLVVAMPLAEAGPTVRLVRDELDQVPVRGLEIQLLPDTLGTSPIVTRARWASKVDDVVAVVAGALIRYSAVSAPIYNEAGIPQVVPSATSPLLRAAGPWTFTQVPSNAAQADFIIDFMSTALQARTVTIFYSSAAYGSGLKNALTRALEGARAHILDIVPVTYPLDANALVGSALLRGEPDVVLLVAGPDYTELLVQEWANSGAGGVLIATDRSTRGLDPARNLGPDRFFRVGFWHWTSRDEGSQAFTRRFRDANGRIPSQREA